MSLEWLLNRACRIDGLLDEKIFIWRRDTSVTLVSLAGPVGEYAEAWGVDILNAAFNTSAAQEELRWNPAPLPPAAPGARRRLEQRRYQA
jgi:hypothetical protein